MQVIGSAMELEKHHDYHHLLDSESALPVGNDLKNGRRREGASATVMMLIGGDIEDEDKRVRFQEQEDFRADCEMKEEFGLEYVSSRCTKRCSFSKHQGPKRHHFSNEENDVA
ncbi:hypothetical protein I3843_16G109400 [Carya illinoinensis]|nr:hypothetical protein I3843_16G109400 [Carya illinoinensis]